MSLALNEWKTRLKIKQQENLETSLKKNNKKDVYIKTDYRKYNLKPKKGFKTITLPAKINKQINCDKEIQQAKQVLYTS